MRRGTFLVALVALLAAPYKLLALAPKTWQPKLVGGKWDGLVLPAQDGALPMYRMFVGDWSDNVKSDDCHYVPSGQQTPDGYTEYIHRPIVSGSDFGKHSIAMQAPK